MTADVNVSSLKPEWLDSLVMDGVLNQRMSRSDFLRFLSRSVLGSLALGMLPLVFSKSHLGNGSRACKVFHRGVLYEKHSLAG